MKIYYRNAALDADIVASSNLLGYNVSRLVDLSPNTKLKFTGKADEYVIFDLGAAMPVSALGVFGLNCTMAADITLEGNTADSWASPAFSLAVTCASPIAEDFTQQTYRYWRLRIEDPTNPSNLEVGMVYLGLAASIAYVSPDVRIPRVTYGNPSRTRSGQIRGEARYSVYAPSFNLNFLPETPRAALQAIWDAQGNTEPFVLIIWEDSTTVVPPLYGTFTMESMDFVKLAEHGAVYSTSFSFEEVL